MLGHHWESGEATIVACEEEHAFVGAPFDASARVYVVDVRLACGTPMFRTQVRRTYTHRESLNPERALGAGEVISVLCDLKHDKLKFDESDPRLYKDGWVPGTGRYHAPAPSDPAFEAAAAAPPGTPPPGAAMPNELPDALSEPVADILQQITSDPEGLRQRLRAPGSGASAFVVADTDVSPLGHPRGRQQTDVADQLSKLAALRDRGVLTAAEFEAQKQKLLDT